MAFPERFSNLPEYAFPRLRALLDHHQPGGAPVAMTIGEPRHEMPPFLTDVLNAHLDGFAKYPVNEGIPELLEAIQGWISRRYGASLAAENLMVLNGTREGLFNAALALCPEQKNGQTPVILTPNPFYQAYAVASLVLGAESIYVPATEASGHLPDYANLPAELLDRVAIVYICSPANPQGSVADAAYLRNLITLAERHDFQIFADECYSEIYRDTPPPGVLQIAAEMGVSPERVLSFHSLSKRSNMPGLRSGFVAGGAESIRRIRQLRAYAGAPLPAPLQHVAAAAWNDEKHVNRSRALYQQKYALADRIFAGVDGYQGPEAGFFLWLPVEDGEAAALHLWKQTGIRVLPGAYLSRDSGDLNPGKQFIRVAMVAPIDELEEALRRLRNCLYP
ncbi:aminotransferase class I/II-fold pyridoxal phosphate-dependent enzyme [Roseinatronobacter bogoriensis]|uniref:Aspartate aminotransferase n=1 Tax=Roseinatronobacter bogoriensis subsp. barguzinensis TaxID=441209 RepID=A0A2K8KAM2_9RHOB|nr:MULTISPECIES: aminotransferase class I/II-fold pyridoxal phosphate-dependent enzyme [Rhodobaca]ATX64735.1 aspartate aminotransferase [Rhodobaca barguzinensis]MBB4208514.1 aspartate/methionine/tyrosine aminotransferase [Rhodobaca bogoriensis DSM 18756]TDW38217.1 aspartate/methionine/tyrosine aminotransferase [Rhodobaca barguzinensis]TDY69612.1 aspartate/methionine/tyrosine aminotransferase [Rhodobaca bogoriensis DSM 18756]